MAGIYIHIPYCKQACSYCNFHFSTQRSTKEDLLNALSLELKLRRDFFDKPDVRIESIYLGGGTPSLLSKEELNSVLDFVHQFYTVKDDVEITIETNPDDLDASYLNELRELGVNRLSIGVQSFHNNDLASMNRAHSSAQAVQAIETAIQLGVKNISVDLMYNLPGQTLNMWKDNLERLIALKIPHISCYSLTIEEKTALYHQLKNKKIQLPKEGDNIEQYRLLVDLLRRAGYTHYEVSNFSLPGFESKHNSAYWRNMPYLGIGPSAHSYNGKERSWNIANNLLYIKQLQEGKYQPEIECLTLNQKINDRLLTGLRTVWGVNTGELKKEFGGEVHAELISNARPYLDRGLLQLENNVLNLTEEGRLLADKITSDLFFIDES